MAESKEELKSLLKKVEKESGKDTDTIFLVLHSSVLNIPFFTPIKHKLESRFLGEISITSDIQMTPPLWQKAKKN